MTVRFQDTQSSSYHRVQDTWISWGTNWSCFSNIHLFLVLPRIVQWHLPLNYELHTFYRQYRHIIFLMNECFSGKNNKTFHWMAKKILQMPFLYIILKMLHIKSPNIITKQNYPTAKFFHPQIKHFQTYVQFNNIN